MKALKYLITALVLSVLCVIFVSSSQAQQYTLLTAIAGGTNNITAGSTSNYTHSVTATKYEEVGVLTAFKLDGSGTENIVFTFDYSNDASNWATVNQYKWTNAANGTTLVVASTNIYVGSLGYLRLKSIVNGSSGQAVTNLLLKWSLKPQRNGS